MSHKNKQKTFFISSIIFLLLGCTQTPNTGVAPTQPSTILETSIPNRNPTSTFTPQPQVAQEDTGYEGYYTGIVVITEYYTLLGNGLLEEAYERLSISEQNKNSLPEFIQLNKGSTSEIVTIKPLVIWQIEQGISPFIKDKDGRIGFFVELFNSQKGTHTAFLSLVKESENWKIDIISENPINVVLETSTTLMLDIGSVPDRSYYDSILTIAQYYLFNNYSLYERAYGLLSPFRPYAQSFEEYLTYYLSYIREIENIQIIEILSIRPFYERALHFQYITTPDPEIRRKFIVTLNYVKGKSSAIEESNTQSRFITTVFENKEWHVYSINTSP